MGKILIELAGENQTQHGVAQKFQSLIVLTSRAVFVRDRRMRERQAQEIFVPKTVAEADLKFGEVGHGDLINRGRLLRRRQGFTLCVGGCCHCRRRSFSRWHR